MIPPVSGVSQLWLGVADDVIGGPAGGLVSAEDHLHLLLAERAELLHGEDAVETLCGRRSRSAADHCTPTPYRHGSACAHL